MGTNNSNEQEIKLNILISKLKNQDSRYAKTCKNIIYAYIIIIGLNALLLLFSQFHSFSLNLLIRDSFTITGSIIMLVFFINIYKEYKYVDYAKPTLVMLKRAAYRYQFLQIRYFWLLLAIVLLDIGIMLKFEGEQLKLFQCIFIGAFIVGFIIGAILWLKKYEPLHSASLNLIKELEN